MLKFYTYVCKRCHNLLMMSMNISDIAIINIKSTDDCCIIIGISRKEAVDLMLNIDLTENAEHYKA